MREDRESESERDRTSAILYVLTYVHVYVYVYVCVCVCVFEDSKLSFHKHGVVFIQKNLKSINPTSKNQVFDCFSAQEDFHMRLSKLLGE